MTHKAHNQANATELKNTLKIIVSSILINDDFRTSCNTPDRKENLSFFDWLVEKKYEKTFYLYYQRLIECEDRLEQAKQELLCGKIKAGDIYVSWDELKNEHGYLYKTKNDWEENKKKNIHLQQIQTNRVRHKIQAFISEFAKSRPAVLSENEMEEQLQTAIVCIREKLIPTNKY